MARDANARVPLTFDEESADLPMAELSKEELVRRMTPVMLEREAQFKRARASGLASLDDAAEMVGSSVENVSRLMGVAAESGKSLDDVVGITAKLQSAMISAEQDTCRAAEAFKALGLNRRKLRLPHERINRGK